MAQYPKELEDLIQEYLTDGIITAKEREVLLKKAESLGLDRDEVDLYIDAQQQKADQAVDSAVKKQRGQTCPFCGGSIPMLADKCPHCGQTITPEASGELTEIIDKLEEALVEFKSGKDLKKHKANVERYMRKAEMYYGSNPKIQTLVAQVKAEAEAAEKQAKSEEKKKTIMNLLKKFWWVLLIVILILIAVISNAIDESNAKNDPTTNATVCAQQISEALKADEPDKAMNLYNGFDGSKFDLKNSLNDIFNYYVEKNNADKAAFIFNEHYKYDLKNGVYKEKIAEIYLKEGEYEKAGQILDDASMDNLPLFVKIVKQMKKDGVDKDEIKVYVTTLEGQADHYGGSQHKEAYKEALEPLVK